MDRLNFSVNNTINVRGWVKYFGISTPGVLLDIIIKVPE
jgi:hypothetical protein